jgi:hypothetical protein
VEPAFHGEGSLRVEGRDRRGRELRTHRVVPTACRIVGAALAIGSTTRVALITSISAFLVSVVIWPPQKRRFIRSASATPSALAARSSAEVVPQER